MLDEFPALGRLDFFESALAFMAGYGLKLIHDRATSSRPAGKRQAREGVVRSNEVLCETEIRATETRARIPSQETIAGFIDLDVKGLCLQWRNHLGGIPPAHLPRWLLLRILAYRVQVGALGGRCASCVSRRARRSNLQTGVLSRRGFRQRGKEPA